MRLALINSITLFLIGGMLVACSTQFYQYHLG